MNKAERDNLRRIANPWTIQRDFETGRGIVDFEPTLELVRAILLLLDYVDTLEAAAERARGIAGIMSSSGAREIFTILSEALDKGK